MLSVIYHDKYGRQYHELLDVRIYALRDGADYFGIGIKRITNYSNEIIIE